MINNRLFQWYGIDTQKNLNLKTFCPRPFDTVLIDKTGSCFICECTGWLPQSIGNLNLLSLEELLQSNTAKIIQKSILDGSYRYCNSDQCSYLLDERQEKNKKWKTKIPQRLIKNVRLAIDDSCNLSCPSCRTKKIFESDKQKLKKRYRLADKVIDFIGSQKQTINVHIGSDGDPFASLVYRYFIRKASLLSNITFTVQTNGLLVKKIHIKNKNLFNNLKTLNVSMDGATPNTYQKLRRGGSFHKILENLEEIKKLKSVYNFSFIIHYVVQSDNFKEMLDMVELAKQYDADRLWFNRITNWNTYKNFLNVDVLNPLNPMHKDYLQVEKQIKTIAMDTSKILIEMPTLTNQTIK